MLTTLISGLLDVTDHVDKGAGAAVTLPVVVRRDGEDASLVVAADKGTATFSDIADEVAKSYGFGLGDAFASGGSIGYDHKAMGITAKGAWESVKRHFREMGVDTQSQDFTVVGVSVVSSSPLAVPLGNWPTLALAGVKWKSVHANLLVAGLQQTGSTRSAAGLLSRYWLGSVMV